MSLSLMKRTNYRIRQEKNKNILQGISGEAFITPPAPVSKNLIMNEATNILRKSH